MSVSDFDNRVNKPLRQLARRLRIGRAIMGVGDAALVALAGMAGQLLLDWSLRLPVDMRAALLAVVVGSVLWVLWRRVLSPLRLTFGARELAGVVERRFPQLDALLVSAVDFHAGRVGAATSNSGQLVHAVVRQAADQADEIPFHRTLNGAPVRRGAAKTLGVLAVLVVAFLGQPQTMGVWFERNVVLRDVAWPKRTLLRVEAPKDGVVRGAVGDDLEIRARVEPGYVVPRQVEIVYETRSGKTGRETMTGVGERGLRIVFPRAREAFRFRLMGGDDVTEWYDTKLTQRPAIASATLTVAAPAYTRRGTITLSEGQRAAEMYAGSTLTIAAESSKPLAEARLMVDGAPAADVVFEKTHLRAEVTPDESRTYHFALRDLDGLENRRPVRFSARLLEDRAPTVRLQLPNVGNMVTPPAVLPVEVEYKDDLGLATVAVTFQVSGEGADAAPRALPLEGFAPPVSVYETRTDWPLADSGATVGAQVTVFAEATDFNDVTGPGHGESTAIAFRVVTPEELQTVFNRREQEYRRQLERIVESQERVRRDLLTLVERINDPAVREDWALALAPLERRQRQIAAQLNIVRQQFAQILVEMGINRLDSAEVRQRIGGGIVQPLKALGGRELPDAADLLRRLGREGSRELADRVDPAQALILTRMRRVLDNMLTWEGFQETVTMLREIMRLQEELNAETQQEIERQGEDVFDDQ